LLCDMTDDELHYDEFILEPDTNYPYYITAKRYWASLEINERDETTQTTLVCLHSTSFHKETWEPTISRIFHGSSNSQSHRSRPRDAWVIECPNHGASAVLNDGLLQRPEHSGSFTCERYAQAVYRFLHSKYFNLPQRSKQDLVGLGHSLGGVAMIILQAILPVVSFREIFIVEPMISPLGQDSLSRLRKRLIKGAQNRPDTWPDRAAARRSLASGNGKNWDARVLDVYVKHALKDVESPSRSVTLCCTKMEEAAMYRDAHGPVAPVKDLDVACTKLPIHIVFGQINDFIPKEVQDATIDPSSPRRFESVSYIQGVGHLVPQQAPDALAELIISLLDGSYVRVPTGGQTFDRRSKL